MCILFVDDEVLITMVAEDTLRDAGHKVMTACHVQGALGLMADHANCLTRLIQRHGRDSVAGIA